MRYRLEQPPAISGSGEEQLRKIHAYLFRMAEQLNVAMDGLSEGGTGESASAVGAYAPSGAPSAAVNPNELQALVVNTAEILHSEMDRLEQVLRGEYTAISSQWGVYKEQMQNTITATAQGIVQEYGFASDIRTLEEQAAGFSRYQTETRGFIRQGFVERDGAGVPVIGIAIGQSLTGVETVVNGQTLLELDQTQSCAFYTAERVSFRIHGQEVAYLSNRRLYVADVEVTGALTVGKWLLEGGSGLTVKYIG